MPHRLRRKPPGLVWSIRKNERDNLFGKKASEAIAGPETLDMGGQFLTNKKRIETESKLFTSAQPKSKGCHLHLHFNTGFGPKELPEWARHVQDTMFIRPTRPLLVSEDYEVVNVMFSVRPADTPTSNAEAWVMKKLVLQEKEVYGVKQTVNWCARLNQGTRAIRGLVNHEGAYRHYIGETIDNMVKERVMYAELRPYADG
ncbi:hypothetical protein LTR28_003324 [Elasticomyces elasticus]|nr:hypothetical protein LTR28_003324 [Elasticomyces elasticus]